MKRSGSQPVPDPKRSGLSPVAERTRSGPQAVPKDMSRSGSRRPTAAQPVLRAAGPTVARAWLWGVLLALLGGGLVLLAALRS